MAGGPRPRRTEAIGHWHLEEQGELASQRNEHLGELNEVLHKVAKKRVEHGRAAAAVDVVVEAGAAHAVATTAASAQAVAEHLAGAAASADALIKAGNGDIAALTRPSAGARRRIF